MELYERLTTARETPTPAERDPFADLKNRIHFAVIGDLGPQLFNVNMDPEALRERVLADVRDQLAQETGISRDDRQRIALEVTDDAKDYISAIGYDSNFGARPLGRVIQNEIEDPLAEMLLQGKFKTGDHVRVDAREKKLVIEKAEEKQPAATTV